jgi:hypothetical protein
MADVLADLIARLEAAFEGGPELDARLQALEHGEEFDRLNDPAFNSHDAFSTVWIAKSGKRYTCWGNKAYTRSHDAAISLIPAEFFYAFAAGRTRPDEPLFGAAIYAPVISDEPAIIAESEHATSLPLAICIAALKTRDSRVTP